MSYKKSVLFSVSIVLILNFLSSGILFAIPDNPLIPDDAPIYNLDDIVFNVNKGKANIPVIEREAKVLEHAIVTKGYASIYDYRQAVKNETKSKDKENNEFFSVVLYRPDESSHLLYTGVYPEFEITDEEVSPSAYEITPIDMQFQETPYLFSFAKENGDNILMEVYRADDHIVFYIKVQSFFKKGSRERVWDAKTKRWIWKILKINKLKTIKKYTVKMKQYYREKRTFDMINVYPVSGDMRFFKIDLTFIGIKCIKELKFILSFPEGVAKIIRDPDYKTDIVIDIPPAITQYSMPISPVNNYTTTTLNSHNTFIIQKPDASGKNGALKVLAVKESKKKTKSVVINDLEIQDLINLIMHPERAVVDSDGNLYIINNEDFGTVIYVMAKNGLVFRFTVPTSCDRCIVWNSKHKRIYVPVEANTFYALEFDLSNPFISTMGNIKEKIEEL